MQLYVLTGPDTRAARERASALLASARVDPGAVERFDLSEDGGHRLVGAAQTLSLFGGPRVLVAEPVNALSAACAGRLNAVVNDITVILMGAPAPVVLVRRALPTALFETFATPAPREAAVRLGQLAADLGLSLEPRAAAALAEHAAHNWARTVGALHQLAEMGASVVTGQQAADAMGSAQARGVPWALSDALERGDLAGALAVGATLEPVAAVGYLARRVWQAGMAVDADTLTRAGKAAPTGLTSAESRRVGALARHLGPRGVQASWDLIARADRAVKLSPSPHLELDALTVRLCALWGSTPR